jgi:hypothetical protein
MAALGALLLRWRLKWIFGCGLACGIVRFGLSALDDRVWILSGVVLHGCSFALVFVTAQIYIDQRVPPAWRARAQALMALMSGGVGNLTGYLSAGIWFRVCTDGGVTRWSLLWGGLAVAVAVVSAYFQIAYHGRGVPPRRSISEDFAGQKETQSG